MKVKKEISVVDIEIKSIGEIIDALKPLDDEAAQRALEYGRLWQRDRITSAKSTKIEGEKP